MNNKLLIAWASALVFGFAFVVPHYHPPSKAADDFVPWESEQVYVKYRGYVDLASFACTDTPRSSWIERICYNSQYNYLLVSMKGTYYHFCGVDPSTEYYFRTASSVGTFYHTHIKGQFDCRVS